MLLDIKYHACNSLTSYWNGKGKYSNYINGKGKQNS